MNGRSRRDSAALMPSGKGPLSTQPGRFTRPPASAAFGGAAVARFLSRVPARGHITNDNVLYSLPKNSQLFARLEQNLQGTLRTVVFTTSANLPDNQALSSHRYAVLLSVVMTDTPPLSNLYINVDNYVSYRAHKVLPFRQVIFSRIFRANASPIISS
jgi:hypothetical protein